MEFLPLKQFESTRLAFAAALSTVHRGSVRSSAMIGSDCEELFYKQPGSRVDRGLCDTVVRIIREGGYTIQHYQTRRVKRGRQNRIVSAFTFVHADGRAAGWGYSYKLHRTTLVIQLRIPGKDIVILPPCDYSTQTTKKCYDEAGITWLDFKRGHHIRVPMVHEKHVSYATGLGSLQYGVTKVFIDRYEGHLLFDEPLSRARVLTTSSPISDTVDIPKFIRDAVEKAEKLRESPGYMLSTGMAATPYQVFKFIMSLADKTVDVYSPKICERMVKWGRSLDRFLENFEGENMAYFYLRYMSVTEPGKVIRSRHGYPVAHQE